MVAIAARIPLLRRAPIENWQPALMIAAISLCLVVGRIGTDQQLPTDSCPTQRGNGVADQPDCAVSGGGCAAAEPGGGNDRR